MNCKQDSTLPVVPSPGWLLKPQTVQVTSAKVVISFLTVLPRTLHFCRLNPERRHIKPKTASSNLYKLIQILSQVGVYAWNPCNWEAETRGLYEFEAKIVYIVTSRLAIALQGDPDLKKRKIKGQERWFSS